MIIGLRHAGLVVENLETALDFYVRLLGFAETRRMEEGGGNTCKPCSASLAPGRLP